MGKMRLEDGTKLLVILPTDGLRVRAFLQRHYANELLKLVQRLEHERERTAA